MNAIAREADPEDNAVSRAHRVGGEIAVECAIVDHLADAPKRRSGNPTWRRRRATPARNHWKRGGSERWDSSIGTRRETASGSRACRPWRKARPARRRRRPCQTQPGGPSPRPKSLVQSFPPVNWSSVPANVVTVQPRGCPGQESIQPITIPQLQCYTARCGIFAEEVVCRSAMFSQQECSPLQLLDVVQETAEPVQRSCPSHRLSSPHPLSTW